MKLGYRPALDGLRGLAVLLVLAGHAGLPLMHHSQNTGVTTFFTLSGFLITFLLLTEIQTTGRLNLAAFYLRRALRLLPALLFLIAVLGLGVHIVNRIGVHYQPNFWRNAGYAVLYVGNFVRAGGESMTLFNHTWSLSVEEQFYLIWPGVVIGLTWWSRRNPRHVAVVLTTLALVFTVWRVAVLHVFDGGLYTYYGPDTNAFALTAGAALAAWMRVSRRACLPRRGAALGLCVIAFGAMCPWFVLYSTSFTPEIPAFAAVVGTVLVLSATMDGHALLEWSPLRWLGTVSYGVYLWHYPLIMLVIYAPRHLPQPWLNLAMCALSIVVAAISFYAVEKPILRFKHVLQKPAVPAPTAADDPAPALT